MRFEIVTAYIMGIALPVLEVLRRRTNFETIAGYVDDFIIGGLLLYAARAASLQRPNGRVYLVAAWAILCGGMYGSFFFQIESRAEHDISGLPNTTVVIVKGVIFSIALVSLILSVRAAGTSSRSP